MTIFYLPDLGEGLAEAEIREWYVKIGDHVKVDQPLVSMETAKAVVDVPSPYEGTIASLHGKANDIIQTGAPLITMTLANEKSEEDAGSVVGKLEKHDGSWQEETVTQQAAYAAKGHVASASIKAIPAARLLAKQLNIDLGTVTPTGANGLITVEDVQNRAAGTSHTKSATATKGKALSGLRRAMHASMEKSHSEVVPVSVMDEIDVSHLSKEADVTALLLTALCQAVRVVPELNAWFHKDTMSLETFSQVDVGLAINTPEGLVVPVIHSAEALDQTALREKINTYKKAAYDRTLSSDALRGATITFTNFGSIMGRYGTPIIVPPMVAIIGVGRIRDAALVRDGQVVAGRLLPVSITVDHRVISGGEMTHFLGAMAEHIRQAKA